MFFNPSYISIYLLSLNVCAYVCVYICPPLKIENACLRPFAGHIPSTRQAPIPATGKATPISTAQRTRGGTPAGRNAAGRSRPRQGCQVASLQGCGTPGLPGRGTGQPGRGTGRANLHRDRARVSPPRPPRSRPVRPIASLASPCQRPVGRSNRASLACWGLNLGNARFNPPPCEGERPPESFIMAARRKSLPRHPPVRGWVPLCYPPPPHALSAGVPRPKTVFLKK